MSLNLPIRISEDMRTWAFAILSFVVLFASAGMAAQYWAGLAGVAKQSTDIVTPDIYIAKLRQLSAVHPSVALIGDSQIVGEAMAQNGDRHWRRHTLDRVLESKLRQRTGLETTQIVNFGANGLLPTDLEFMVRDALDQSVDTVAFNVSLRFLSADFDQPKDEQSRVWLRDLCRHDAIVRGCGLAGLSSYVPMYDLSAVLQQQYLGGPLQGAIPRAAKDLYQRWLAKSDDVITNAMLLLVQARSRFKSVAFDENRKQVRALQRTFEAIESRHARALVFYSVEEPLQFDQIMPRGDADAVRSGLLAWLKSFQSDRVRIVGADYKIPARHYLDYLHLDDGGYVLLADNLLDPLAALIEMPSGVQASAKPKLP